MNQNTSPDTHEWIQHLPDGAVSVEQQGTTLVLRASNKLQEQFETLLEKKKIGTLSSQEEQEYRAICDLDTALSWLNRLAREDKND